MLQYEKKYEAAMKTVNALKVGIQSIFNKIGCNTPANMEMLGNEVQLVWVVLAWPCAWRWDDVSTVRVLIGLARAPDQLSEPGFGCPVGLPQRESLQRPGVQKRAACSSVACTTIHAA